MVAKLEATIEQQASGLQVDTPANSDGSDEDSSPGAYRPDSTDVGKVPAQKRARQTQTAWESAYRLPSSSTAPEAARPILMKTNAFCASESEARRY